MNSGQHPQEWGVTTGSDRLEVLLDGPGSRLEQEQNDPDTEEAFRSGRALTRPAEFFAGRFHTPISAARSRSPRSFHALRARSTATAVTAMSAAPAGKK